MSSVYIRFEIYHCKIFKFFVSPINFFQIHAPFFIWLSISAEKKHFIVVSPDHLHLPERFKILYCFGINIIWQQFMQLINAIIGDIFKDIFQPFLRMNIIDFATGKEVVKYCWSLRSFVRNRKEVIFSSQGNRSDCFFNQVIFNMQVSIMKVIP